MKDEENQSDEQAEEAARLALEAREKKSFQAEEAARLQRVALLNEAIDENPVAKHILKHINNIDYNIGAMESKMDGLFLKVSEMEKTIDSIKFVVESEE